jgi:hypothetical protein
MLRRLLWVLSAIAAIGGIVLVFATNVPLAIVAPTAAAYAYLLCAAARDPVRYVAVIDAAVVQLALAVWIYALRPKPVVTAATAAL